MEREEKQKQDKKLIYLAQYEEQQEQGLRYEENSDEDANSNADSDGGMPPKISCKAANEAQALSNDETRQRSSCQCQATNINTLKNSNPHPNHQRL
ncbi:hypothetical protein ACLKA6_016369 [Drosophila palustris]